jgi:hypothetical protein
MGLPLCHVIRALRAFGIAPNVEIATRCQQHIHYTCNVFDQILAGPVSALRQMSDR